MPKILTAANTPRSRIYLDGVEVGSVTKACPTEGWLERIVVHDGKPQINTNGDVLTEVRHGIVTVEVWDGGPAES
jgi:hypothetical protein